MTKVRWHIAPNGHPCACIEEDHDRQPSVVLVMMLPEVVALLSAEGRAERWVFGEPDEDGFYTPTIYSIVP